MAKSLSTLKYLDKALGGLRELGLLKGDSDPVPVITLLDQISDLDQGSPFQKTGRPSGGLTAAFERVAAFKYKKV